MSILDLSPEVLTLYGLGGGGGDTFTDIVYLAATAPLDHTNTSTLQDTGISYTFSEAGDYIVTVQVMTSIAAAADGTGGLIIFLTDDAGSPLDYGSWACPATPLVTGGTYYDTASFDVPVTSDGSDGVKVMILVDPTTALSGAAVGGGTGSQFGISRVRITKL